jgi:tetratricopeptide (TPR) repeat protein
MRAYCVILICLFGFPGCKSANDYLREAGLLEEQGKYKEAIILLDKAIAKDKDLIGAYINRGADKSALNDYKGAIEDYERALTIDPKNTLAIFNIGNNYKRLEQYKLSIDYYDKAFRTKGGEPLYIDYTPNKFVDMSKFDVAGHAISYERAIAFYHLDSLKKSYTDFQHSISKGYMIADCYQWIGYIYIISGQRKEACEYFQKAIFAGNKSAEDDINKYCTK